MKRATWLRAGIAGLLLCTVTLALLWAAGVFNRGGQLALVDGDKAKKALLRTASAKNAG